MKKFLCVALIATFCASTALQSTKVYPDHTWRNRAIAATILSGLGTAGSHFMGYKRHDKRRRTMAQKLVAGGMSKLERVQLLQEMKRVNRRAQTWEYLRNALALLTPALAVGTYGRHQYENLLAKSNS